MTIAVTIPADRTLHRPTPVANRAAGEGSEPGGCFGDGMTAAHHLDERTALDAADQADPAPRQRPLLVRHAGIQIARRAMDLRGGAHGAAGAPVACARLGQRTDHGQQHAAIDRIGRRIEAAAQRTGAANPAHVDRQRHAAIVARRRVAPQFTDEHDRGRGLSVRARHTRSGATRVRALTARNRFERDAQRRPPRVTPRRTREQHSPAAESGGDSGREQQFATAADGMNDTGRRDDQKEDEE